MLFFVTAFPNLGPSELADPRLGKPISTIPSGKYFGFNFLWKISQAGGEVNILQESRLLFEIQFLKSFLFFFFFFFKEFWLCLFQQFFFSCSSACHLSLVSCQKLAFSWAPRDLKHLGRLDGWEKLTKRVRNDVSNFLLFLARLVFCVGGKNLWNHFKCCTEIQTRRARLIKSTNT